MCSEIRTPVIRLPAGRLGVQFPGQTLGLLDIFFEMRNGIEIRIYTYFINHLKYKGVECVTVLVQCSRL
jgi:hypothetical protein